MRLARVLAKVGNPIDDVGGSLVRRAGGVADCPACPVRNHSGSGLAARGLPPNRSVAGPPGTAGTAHCLYSP